jgi:hypothetical protein
MKNDDLAKKGTTLNDLEFRLMGGNSHNHGLVIKVPFKGTVSQL